MSTFRLTDTPVTNTAVEEIKQPEVQETNKADKAKDVEEKPQGIKEIILKGPLGHAYTEALQLLLNKQTNASRDIRQESVQQAFQAKLFIEGEEPTDSIPDNAKGFVYIYDGKTMGLGDLTNLFDDIAGAKEAHPDAGYISGVIQNAEHLLKDQTKAKNLETMTKALEEMKVPLHFSEPAAISGIMGFLQKKD